MFDGLRLRNNAMTGEIGTDIAMPLETLIDILARRYGYSLKKFQTGNKRRNLLQAHDRVVALIKRIHPNVSLPELGDIMNKDHASILIAIRRGEKLLANDNGPDFKSAANNTELF